MTVKGILKPQNRRVSISRYPLLKTVRYRSTILVMSILSKLPTLLQHQKTKTVITSHQAADAAVFSRRVQLESRLFFLSFQFAGLLFVLVEETCDFMESKVFVICDVIESICFSSMYLLFVTSALIVSAIHLTQS